MIDRHTRTRVYSPDEAPEDPSFYDRHGRKGITGMQPVNFTAFREAERRYKARAGGVLDLSGVIDLQSLTDESSVDPRVRKMRKVSCAGCLRGDKELWLWEVLDGVGGGFSFIPGALDERQQKYWIQQAICSYMSPPNATNLDAHYKIPQEGLWYHLRQALAEEARRLTITRIPHPDDSEKSRAQPLELSFGKDDIISLMHKIRWVTLGFQYDWTTKEYDFTRSPVPFPQDLADWSAQICRAAGFGDTFRAEAGIVNLYQPNDTLTGHVDRSERDMQMPLISLSLGSSCIFLLGGPSRDDPVTPILLRPGDVILMSGASRRYFHGVPRIVPNPSERIVPTEEDPEALRVALSILGDARININIRQVNT